VFTFQQLETDHPKGEKITKPPHPIMYFLGQKRKKRKQKVWSKVLTDKKEKLVPIDKEPSPPHFFIWMSKIVKFKSPRGMG
jgi:hypothetical protein